MVELYNVIEKLCTKNNINITTMCKDAGVSRAPLSDLKMGRSKTLSTETMTKIASYFNVTVDYLLGNEEKLIKSSEPSKRNLVSLSRLQDADISPEQDKYLADFIDFLIRKKNEN